MFHQLEDVGLITFQKADEMLRQKEAIFNRKWKIALVTDSTCDLPQELVDHYQINMVPLNINFGESHYLDKITIQPHQFYELLDQHKDFPKTSQVHERAFTNEYARLAAHYDSIIALQLTDKFSGTYSSSHKAAQTASKEFKKPITVINSKNLSGALGLIALRAAQAIEAGHRHDEIVPAAERWIKDTHIFVSVKTLEYMVRGGRVSHIKGLIARMLNINPIVSMDENGASFAFGRTHSQRSNIVYQTDSWTINIKPYFSKEIRALLGNVYPGNTNYLKFRNFYRSYLSIYLLLFTTYIFFNHNQTMEKIEVGSPLPRFVLPDQDGNVFDIDSVLGKKNLVIFFYPKDDSPGCTEQACYFRDRFEVFNEADAVIIGISGQSVQSHNQFAQKNRLNYTLLSDEGNKIRSLLGVPSNLLGMVPGRVSYVVDKAGKVVYLFNSQIQTTKHVDEALRILKELR